MSEKKKRYNAIDGLRTFSAIGVVVMHVLVNGKYNRTGYIMETIIPSWGQVVFLFMMISAFSMCCGYHEKILNNEINLREFYYKRFVKIWPMFAFLCMIDFIMSPSIESIYEIFANLTLCFGFLPNHDISVIGVGWFLGVVFVFYIIFPFFCCLVSSKLSAWCSFVAALVFNVLCTVYFFDKNHMTSDFVYKHNFIYCAVFFFAGALIYLYRKELSEFSEKRKWVMLVACVAGTVLFYITNGSIYSMLIVFSLYLIYALGSGRKILESRVARFISGISLEIYLSHMVIFRVLEKMRLTKLFGSGVLSFVITSIATFIGTILFSLIVKKILDRIVAFCEKKVKIRSLSNNC